MKTLFLILILAFAVSAQKVEVDQSYIDSATKAFKEVIALRAAMDAKTSEAEAWKQVSEANERAAKAKDELILIKDERITELTKLKCNKTSFFFGVVKLTRCY